MNRRNRAFASYAWHSQRLFEMAAALGVSPVRRAGRRRARTSAASPDGKLRRSPRRNPPPTPPTSARYVGSRRLPAMSRRDLRALVAHAHGEHHHRPESESARRARRFQNAESACRLHARGRGVRVRHEVEAALFHPQGKRLLPGERAVGCHEQGMAAVSPAAEHRVVGESLPREPGTTARGRRAALRRVPFDELRRQDQASTEWNVGCERCHGPGSAHVARPSRANIIDPARLDYVSGKRHVHPMPLAGKAADESPLPGSCTTGRSDSTWGSSSRISGSSRNIISASRVTRTTRKAPRGRTACRETTSWTASMYRQRGDLLELP